MRFRRLAAALAFSAAILTLVLPAASKAAWPGRNGKIVFMAADFSFDHLWSVNPDGTDLHVFFTSPRQYDQDPEVSPDGTMVAFIEDPAPAGGVGTVHMDGSRGPISGPGCSNGIFAERCLDGTGPIWSPNSHRLLWTQVDDRGARVLVADASGASSIYSDPALDVHSPRWSPDSAKISFIQGGSIYVMDADGSHINPASAQFPPDPGRSPISPDDHKLIYTQPVPSGSPSRQIFISNANGTDPQQLTAVYNICPFISLPPCFGTQPLDPASLVWQSLPPIACALVATIPGPPKEIQVMVQDSTLGLQSISVSKSTNADTDVSPFVTGTKAPVVVTSTKLNQTTASTLALRITDLYGNVTTCDPVVPGAPLRVHNPLASIVLAFLMQVKDTTTL
jgi:hypothetical protein